MKDDMLELTISDNGIGFDPLSIKDGNGQKTMRERAERLQGTLTVVSEKNKGTTITLSFPIHRKT
jgi:two-component system, NarL family, sensor kinase